jgi:hypothetical protein
MFGAKLLDSRNAVLHRLLLKEKARTDALFKGFNGSIPDKLMVKHKTILAALDIFS